MSMYQSVGGAREATVARPLGSPGGAKLDVAFGSYPLAVLERPGQVGLPSANGPRTYADCRLVTDGLALTRPCICKRIAKIVEEHGVAVGQGGSAEEWVAAMDQPLARSATIRREGWLSRDSRALAAEEVDDAFNSVTSR